MGTIPTAIAVPMLLTSRKRRAEISVLQLQVDGVNPELTKGNEGNEGNNRDQKYTPREYFYPPCEETLH